MAENRMSVGDADRVATALVETVETFADTCPDFEGWEMIFGDGVMQGWPPYRDECDPEVAAFAEITIGPDTFVVMTTRKR